MHVKRKAFDIIKKHVLWAAGAGLVPLPVVDVASVTWIQLDMLYKLARLYDVEYSSGSARAFVSALTGSTFARIGASLVKFIPVVGSAIGGVSMSVLSGASTYAIGRVAVTIWESQGDLATIDLLTAKSSYADALTEGQQMVNDLQEDVHAAQDIFEALEKLRRLKDQDLITDAEFTQRKQKLLDKL
jgi:uncharacterized protein (DUF697 family)